MKSKFILLLFCILTAANISALDHEYVPFVREGVKWVCYYENSGRWPMFDNYYSNGRNFFSLEIKGDTIINGKQYKAMHKYCGKTINADNDTIPVYLREEGKTVYAINPERKYYQGLLVGYGDDIGNLTIYQQVWSGEEFVLYDFGNTETYYDSVFYRHNEIEHIMTDTIALGNALVKRDVFHWLEDWYIIEGIGYDGYANKQSGYPLAYMFTQYSPGPPYKLSHVVEKGEIIYKSVNYDPDVGIDEVVADGARRPLDPHYYNLMGQPVGHDVPTTPGIYIHQGKKIVVR